MTRRPRLPARSKRSGHGSRREKCMAARGLRPPKDVGDVLELIRRLPTYIRLVWALLRDSRIPAGQKLILAGIVGYLILPIDLIPDFVPILGQLDDIAVVLLGLDLFIRSAPQAVLDEHLRRIAQAKHQFTG